MFSQLLSKLIHLQESTKFTSPVGAAFAFGCEHCPEEVHWWVLCRHKGLLPLSNLDKFVSKW
ncbi:hypothetical protein PAXINDRAFT_85072 [Paxillus involutus ATCC 200175]|uniref:Uncharacterized protein n=1 Tax=Paxillus involutus ATCC 200175 TaxID=664439 RepID=A0A0C9TT74_PAXIN|nr:hypothetical protein PAXINDRAFT_85072 [Paxillus involutus ATCC 200175]